jgi:Bacteriocin-protection, YdeI or OmpD-Associated/Domain of unknown function (DUF1905)
MLEIPIVEGTFLVQKRIAQSGFKMSYLTYVHILDFPPLRKTGKGTFKVKGFIDGFELKQYNLLPSKDGSMILPLNTNVRKKISKKEGDYVMVVLFADDSPLIIPEYFLVSLMDSPKAHHFFNSLSESNQKYYNDWVEASKKLETKVERMMKTIEKLEKGTRFYDWEKID